jgi:hypothetical protein
MPQYPYPTGRETLDELVQIYSQSSLAVEYRRNLIRNLEARTKTTVVLYEANVRHPAASMNLQDAVFLENVLRQSGSIDDLDLIVNSPGGQGEAADKILHVCRHFCRNGRLRLIVPYFAKSAATMLAFGVDEVVMGPYSELGPTDAQIKVEESGVEHYISAQVYVDTLRVLEDQIRKEEAAGGCASQALLVKLASLNKPFVEHCQRLQLYAMDFAVRWMTKTVLRPEQERDPEKARKLALATAGVFLRSGAYSHGQMLTAKDLARHPDIHIKIKELDGSDASWQTVWQLHCACDVLFGLPAGQGLSKLFESRHTTLPIY